MLMWLGFIACSGAIVVSGYRLSRNGDIIAEKTGLGRSWVGLVLLATVTSLPELVSGISAVAYTHTPDLATGGVLGSCVFNLSILVVMDTLCGKGKPLTSRVDSGNLIAACMGIVLMGFAVFGLYLAPGGWSYMSVGFYSPIIFLVYLVTMRLVFVQGSRESEHNRKQEDLQYAEYGLKESAIAFAVDSAVVIGAAVFLPVTSKAIADQTGLGETFVGNALVALSTSLPELVVSIAAVRIGAVEMSVGNVLGSNVFNMLVLAVDDVFLRTGPILSLSEPHQMVPAVFSIIMTAILITGIAFKAPRKRLPVGFDTLAIAALFAVDMWLLLKLK